MTYDSKGEQCFYKVAYETITDESVAQTEYSSKESLYRSKNGLRINEMSVEDLLPQHTLPHEAYQGELSYTEEAHNQAIKTDSYYLELMSYLEAPIPEKAARNEQG